MRLWRQWHACGHRAGAEGQRRWSANRKRFDLTSNTNKGGINRALFKTIDTRVRTGFLRGTPTQEIADMMMTDITVGGIPGWGGAQRPR